MKATSMKATGTLKQFIALCIWSLFVTATASATSIDLNDFFADPTVVVSLDGSEATLSEDAFLSVVLLSNDPGLGDLNVILAGAGVELTFDYSFVEGTSSNDEFGAFILDSNGISAGPAFEFFTQNTSAGTVSFDLSSLAGEPFIGMQFQLASLLGDGDFNSELTISNVEINQTTPIPEPSSWVLFSVATFGIIGISWFRRKKQHHSQNVT